MQLLRLLAGLIKRIKELQILAAGVSIGYGSIPCGINSEKLKCVAGPSPDTDFHLHSLQLLLSVDSKRGVKETNLERKGCYESKKWPHDKKNEPNKKEPLGVNLMAYEPTEFLSNA